MKNTLDRFMTWMRTRSQETGMITIPRLIYDEAPTWRDLIPFWGVINTLTLFIFRSARFLFSSPYSHLFLVCKTTLHADNSFSLAFFVGISKFLSHLPINFDARKIYNFLLVATCLCQCAKREKQFLFNIFIFPFFLQEGKNGKFDF